MSDIKPREPLSSVAVNLSFRQNPHVQHSDDADGTPSESSSQHPSSTTAAPSQQPLSSQLSQHGDTFVLSQCSQLPAQVSQCAEDTLILLSQNDDDDDDDEYEEGEGEEAHDEEGEQLEAQPSQTVSQGPLRRAREP